MLFYQCRYSFTIQMVIVVVWDNDDINQYLWSQKIYWRCSLSQMGVCNQIDPLILPEECRISNPCQCWDRSVFSKEIRVWLNQFKLNRFLFNPILMLVPSLGKAFGHPLRWKIIILKTIFCVMGRAILSQYVRIDTSTQGHQQWRWQGRQLSSVMHFRTTEGVQAFITYKSVS